MRFENQKVGLQTKFTIVYHFSESVVNICSETNLLPLRISNRDMAFQVGRFTLYYRNKISIQKEKKITLSVESPKYIL